MNNNLEIVVAAIGPPNTGKSTTLGNLLFHNTDSWNDYNRSTFLKNISEKIGPQQNNYRLIFDFERNLKLPFSREVKRAVFSAKDKKVDHSITFIDTPRSFVKQTITQLSQSDAVMLFVDISSFKKITDEDSPQYGKYEFINRKNYTEHYKEYANLAFGFGIKQIILVYSKIDQLKNLKLFKKLHEHMISILKKTGFEDENIQFSLVSNNKNIGVSETSPKLQKLDFIKCDSLLNCIYNLKPTDFTELKDKPFRLAVENSYLVPKVGYVVVGRVLSGKIKLGEKVVLSPCGDYSGVSDYHFYDIYNREIGNKYKEVRSIAKHPMWEFPVPSLKSAEAGMTVGISFRSCNNSSTFSRRTLCRGLVLGTKDHAPLRVESFTAKVKILDIPGEKRPDFVYEMKRNEILKSEYLNETEKACRLEKIEYGIIAGFTPILDTHTTHVNCKFAEILEIFGKEGQKVLKKGDGGLVKLVPYSKNLCVEPYSKNPSLGKFVFRDNGKVIGFGVVDEVKYSRRFQHPHNRNYLPPRSPEPVMQNDTEPDDKLEDQTEYLPKNEMKLKEKFEGEQKLLSALNKSKYGGKNRKINELQERLDIIEENSSDSSSDELSDVDADIKKFSKMQLNFSQSIQKPSLPQDDYNSEDEEQFPPLNKNINK